MDEMNETSISLSMDFFDVYFYVTYLVSLMDVKHLRANNNGARKVPMTKRIKWATCITVTPRSNTVTNIRTL